MPFANTPFSNPDPLADQYNQSPFSSRPTTSDGNSVVGLLSGRQNNAITTDFRDVSFSKTPLLKRSKSQKLLNLIRRGRKSEVSKDQRESVRARLSRSMSTGVRAIPRLLVGERDKELLPEESKALKRRKRRESDERWRLFNLEIEEEKRKWEAENRDKVHTRQEPKAQKKRGKLEHGDESEKEQEYEEEGEKEEEEEEEE
ncbi:hypothetical protein BZA77DRAFT_386578 [Pyronema omphalodes]|nr:hypothetical protein BZA77DRAFT_386578 [Pyronema omphalodes]